jgi:hypothetical protein
MKQDEQLALEFYEQMILCFDSLTEPEKRDLQEFEKKRPTSEWPGWKRRIGDPQDISA